MGFLSGPSKKSLRREKEASERRELARLREEELKAREAAVFAETSGEGISETASINLYNDETLTNTSRAAGLFRGSGKVTEDLIL